MLRPFRHLLPTIAVLAMAGCATPAGTAPSEPASPAPSSTAPSGPTSASPLPSSPASATSLTVEFRAEGNDVTDTYFLQCDGAAPVGSSAAPDPTAACAALATLGPAAFAPADPNIMCTQVIMGPQKARVSGILDGVAVDREFSLTNGCETSRWGSLTGLLGTAEGAL